MGKSDFLSVREPDPQIQRSVLELGALETAVEDALKHLLSEKLSLGVDLKSEAVIPCSDEIPPGWGSEGSHQSR